MKFSTINSEIGCIKKTQIPMKILKINSKIGCFKRNQISTFNLEIRCIKKNQILKKISTKRRMPWKLLKTSVCFCSEKEKKIVSQNDKKYTTLKFIQHYYIQHNTIIDFC